MTNRKVYHLSKVVDLSELNTQEIEALAQDFQWEEYAHGSDIVIQGQERNRYYVLVEGNTEVLDCQGKEEIRVNTFRPGEAFGARSLLTGGTAPFTVRCIENCKVLVASAENFTQMLLRWPKVYNNLIKRMSRNLDQVNYGLWDARQKEFLRSFLQNNQYENKFYGLWGSPRTTKLFESKIAELALARKNVLLIGERGTGRQMMAWHIHKSMFTQTAPFVAVEGRDLERQWGDKFFEKSTYKETPKVDGSLLEIVAGGTLYIKEINQLSLKAQLKLAEVLQSSKNKCLLIGSIEDDSEQLTQFLVPELREIFTAQFKIKPLRDRKRDISFLVEGILEKLAKQHKRKTPSLDHEATKLLLSHNYRHGNITELIQVIERAFFLAEGDTISLEHVFFGPTAEKIGGTFDLLSFPRVAKLIEEGFLVLWLRRFAVLAFSVIILALLIVPQYTVEIGLFALVWGLWWPALALISPFLGRVWCTVCPFSYAMEIVQKKIHWKYPVPDFIKKYDYLLITFLFVLILWLEIVFDMRSNPTSTGILLLTILGAAVLSGIFFTRHAWCHHICPLGGFVGIASIGAMLEVRADATVCMNKCTSYDCYKGNKNVAGCPMSQHAPFVDNNLDCKLCFNCVQSCPNGAVKFNLRIPGREVWHLLRVKQGFVIFIGAALAILIPITFLEPLRQVWSYEKWLLWFSLYYWGFALVAGLLISLIAQPYKTKAASSRIKLVFSLIPLVIAGHISYQLQFLPGVDSILLGLGYRASTGSLHTIGLPILRVSQIFVGITGLILTSFTMIMVIVRSRNKSRRST